MHCVTKYGFHFNLQQKTRCGHAHIGFKFITLPGSRTGQRSVAPIGLIQNFDGIGLDRDASTDGIFGLRTLKIAGTGNFHAGRIGQGDAIGQDLAQLTTVLVAGTEDSHLLANVLLR